MLLLLKLKIVIICFLSIFSLNSLFSQNNAIDMHNKTANKIEVYCLNARNFQPSNADSMSFYISLNKLMTDHQNDTNTKSEFHKNIAKKYADNRQYKLALSYYNYVAFLYEKENNQDELADVYNSIGIIYGKIYNYDKALHYIHKSISILVKDGNDKKLSSSLNNLGIIYRGLKKFDKSLEIIQQSYYFAKRSGNENSIAASLNNISIHFYLIGKYKEALKYQLDAIKIFEKHKNNKRLCSSYNSIGSIYIKLKNKAGLDYFFKSSKLAAELNDQYLLSFAYLSIGSTYLTDKNYPLALDYLKKAEKIALKIHDWVCMKGVNENLTEYYDQIGDAKTALKYHKLYKEINDSIYNKESNERFLDLQVKYEVEEKDNENKILKQESTIQQFAIQKQIYLRNIFIAVSIIITLLVFFTLFRYIIKKKANKLLSIKNQQINIQKNQLEDAFATKDKLFAIITHDLKNPFGTIISLAGYLEESFADIDDNQKEHAVKTIKKSADTAYDLLETLTKWLMSQNKDIPVYKTSFDFIASIQTLLLFYKIDIENKNIDIIFNEYPTIYITADEQMIKTIIRNLLSNAIKFTPKNGTITIDVINNTEEILLTIKDNGVGIKEKDKSNIFNIGSNFTTTGTEKEKGSGLGLVLSKEFADRNNSRIWYESEEGKGSVFYFSISKVNGNGKN